MGNEKKNSESQENCSNKNWIELITLIVSIVVMIVLVWQTWETRKSVESEIKYNNNSIRPWLGVDSIYIEWTNNEHNEFDFSYEIKNYGHNPAKDVSLKSTVNEYQSYKSELSFISAKDSPINSVIFPDKIYESTNRTIKLHERDSLYLHIIVNYSNLNDKKYRTILTYFVRVVDRNYIKVNYDKVIIE